MSRLQQLSISIKTLSPVIVSTKSSSSTMTASHDFFTGSIVRGIIAGKYIEARNLGEAAEQDAEFIELFFSGLRFVAAYPVVKGIRSLVLPLSLQVSKDGNTIKNLLTDEGAAGYKALKGLGIIKDGRISRVTVKKKISLHMSRNNGQDSQISERLAGRSMAGGIFNYEAIDSGQEFCSYVIGEAEQIEQLCKALQISKWNCHIGRSRFTQYGSCQITLGKPVDIEDKAFTEGSKNEIFLRLETPLLADGEQVDDAKGILQQIPEKLNMLTKGGFSLVNTEKSLFARQESVDNFVGVWNMKRPRDFALAAGTIFGLQKNAAWDEADKAALQKIMYEGVGWRCAEGFGQLRLWENKPLQVCGEKEAEAYSSQSIESDVVKEKALMIIRKRIVRAVQNFAADDAWEARGYFGEGIVHSLARLDAILHNAKQYGGLAGLQAELAQEVKGSATPFAKALSGIRIKGKNIKSFLEAGVEYADMPYWQDGRYASLADEKMENVLQDLHIAEGMTYFRDSAEIFYAYWHWFCRYGRKYARKADY